ncbi:MAG: tRNA (N6-isopentenyl adenosine(37)-C2)-methylthiotransferase MiaB [Candidatus Goldbacteria bacterium]|nr:tRNA (N6-isopentenyl adenosine(37)-C2)-methylthiotransferase MiaB [Candidatus Goldiibacteriota bacterium]
MEKIFIRTFGCQMNEYDSERIAGILAKEGKYEFVNTETQADIIIVNTCSVRQHAEDRALSYIGRYVNSKKVIVAGCMAENYKSKLFIKYPKLFAIVGTFNIPYIDKIIKKGGLYTGENKDLYKPDIIRNKSIKSYLTIMQGCNNFCSYCIVPYVRGRERSRPVSEIVQELKILADNGCKEVMLLGQNVNSYFDENKKVNFPQLLKELVKIDGIERIRFMTSHPKDLSDELIETVATEKKLCKHFHLPVQSGSDHVLELMNRNYTSSSYIEKTSKIRKLIKDVAITTDILVGFPCENEKDFEDTVKLVKTVRFDDAFVFKYSVRQGTEAAKLNDDVPETEKLRRLNYILEIQKKISEDINKRFLGRIVDVLVLDRSFKNSLEFKATTETNKKVYIKGTDEMIGKILKVKITEIRSTDAFGGEIV